MDSTNSMVPAKLIWATPDAEKLIVHCARVSNPKSQEIGGREEQLIRYLLKHKHFSPFEMANVCIEINTSRAIARQIIRHRSFCFQEFSQRYSSNIGDQIKVEARVQDLKNRQSSHPTDDEALKQFWDRTQDIVWGMAKSMYDEALQLGIAKEQARALLPEGMTPSRIYMSGTVRSWIHYIQVRSENGTQKEHSEVALACKEVLRNVIPTVIEILDEQSASVQNNDKKDSLA